MKSIFIKRLITYPAIFCIAWYYMYLKFPNFYFCQYIIETFNMVIKNVPNFPEVETKTIFIIFGLSFGYVYGTISTLIKVREFRGFLFFGLFFIKSLISTVAALSFGLVLYPLEILLIPIILLLVKKLKTHKREQGNSHRKIITREDLIKELEKFIKSKQA
ncbi:hypothetical protein [Gottfriedia solisilvae]|uniref:hypothetical protein n=1 Tax=Gottfriedia solisilvae TaxID=1516104 RepID=UPI003D2EC83D